MVFVSEATSHRSKNWQPCSCGSLQDLHGNKYDAKRLPFGGLKDDKVKL